MGDEPFHKPGHLPSQRVPRPDELLFERRRQGSRSPVGGMAIRWRVGTPCWQLHDRCCASAAALQS
jgi:hypothetical protein